MRLPVTRRGTLNAGEDWFPCMILDMSDSGFLIMISREVAVGQVLDFRCELFPGKPLECKIEIRHVTDESVGARIREMDQRGATLCRLFLEEQYADKLNKSG